MSNTATENPLAITWHDSAWIPHLNPSNVMDYFSERSNPFYDKQCNNEQIKMQRLNPDQLPNMAGVEYIVLHIHMNDPMLYVIRKQLRHNPTQATALADYYIISGVVYRAPDLSSVVNSRMLNTLHSLQSAFTEAHSYVQYHPSKGYNWQFKETDEKKTEEKDKNKQKKEDPSSHFQRQRVDDLLVDLARTFPPKSTPPPPETAPVVKPSEVTVKQEKVDIKVEKTDERPQNNSLKPPPDKKAKIMR